MTAKTDDKAAPAAPQQHTGNHPQGQDRQGADRFGGTRTGAENVEPTGKEGRDKRRVPGDTGGGR